MKSSEVRMLKTEPKKVEIGEIFISESMLDKIEESITSGFISYYKITKIDKEKNSYVYEPCYEDIKEG